MKRSNGILGIRTISKIPYLFVDEYQDISQYGHGIILKIAKSNITRVFVVGDPDQSIYRFRYGNSQIGEKAPKSDKQPIKELMNMPDKQCEKRELLVNHRSSKEIVDFVNVYGTLKN